ncbi:MAG: DUF2807 domain-containing protein [Ignavibacteriales bacterium]|nr:MAG: DUF2807 domain-containing protein [Ignavibacteriales bacterium]
MKKAIWAVSIFLAITVIGCNGIGIKGSGILKDEERPVDYFDKIDISGYYEVRISQGDHSSFKIIGDDNLLHLVKSDIEGNTLHIWNKKNISPRRHIKIEIVTESLESISSSGASSIIMKDFKGDELTLEGSGAGSFRLSGKVETLKAELSGAVNLKAEDLEANEVYLELSGACDADVNAKEELRADISGVGNIEYSGNPKILKKSISGLGSITQK